ncbi:hypothetical protein [Dyella acidiphila]|uniref:Lipoprotein n=1 Tax=Dyella acidiphila TaxID=2775866 RepID=A0ABR9G5V2_9GAMM|nr:hypothetical protein [Dyella acidiphila]MBE1159424.1 hypothetical protein [Dyella acidiphila]
MSKRLVRMVTVIGLGALAGCAAQTDVRGVASAQVIVAPASDHPGNRALSSAQVAALSAWINARDDWSGYTADIPDHPILEVQIQGADGQSSNLMVYQRDSGKITAYLYRGHRIAPMARHLSPDDLTTLQSIVNSP